jgi:hypothetical protein
MRVNVHEDTFLDCFRSGPCGTTLATAYGSDLRSVDILRSSRTPSCDFASQSSSRCSSGDLTTLSQVYLALTQPDRYAAGASRSSVNLTPSAQANLRDTERVYEISLRAIRPQSVHFF